MSKSKLPLPYTLEQMKKMSKRNKHGQITGVVRVDIDKIIHCDQDEFLDLLSNALTGSDILGDIAYRVVGHDGNTIRIEVTADPSLVIEFMEVQSEHKEQS